MKISRIIKILKNNFTPLKNVILFESIPDVSDNTKAVFDEMIKRELNRKYKLVWIVSGNSHRFKNYDNVFYLDENDPKQKRQIQKLMISAKCMICCNRFLPRMRWGQKTFYLSHGTTVKSVKSYYTIPDRIDYFIVTSENVMDLQSYELNFDKSRTIPLGFPRNDALTKSNLDVKGYLHTHCKKVIVWYPTFRQHKGGLKSASDVTLPILHNEELAVELNKSAIENDVLIVLKPHFAQDVTYIKDMKLSNIRFIGEDFFEENNICSYEFVAGCDALITDYSSIYFDYTLCNKPIAVIWEDIEEYSKNPGLIDNYEYYLRGAEKLYTLDDLKAFVARLADGTDLLKDERNSVMREVNISNDGKNSERVVNFIMDKLRIT
ncbi:MAG: CDP-glycerol glycerophosphotransferase family protein [Clostridia bacterium]|nr:CDP-glycerol glycerophosphotransferase family protein [Clostridia bacterium]